MTSVEINAKVAALREELSYAMEREDVQSEILISKDIAALLASKLTRSEVRMVDGKFCRVHAKSSR